MVTAKTNLLVWFWTKVHIFSVLSDNTGVITFENVR